jgi:hypothetical protein
VDITFILKNHDTRAPWSELGDICNVYRTGSQGDPSTEKYFIVEITGVPDVSVEKLRALRRALVGDHSVEIGTDAAGAPIYERVNSRLWHVPPEALPTSVKRTLRDTGRITVNWAQAKPFIRRKLERISDSTTYDETKSAAIVDEDVSGA